MTGKTAEKNTGKTMQSKPDMNPDVKPGAKPPMQKAAPGTTKRIFDYIFQYNGMSSQSWYAFWSARPPKPAPLCFCNR